MNAVFVDTGYLCALEITNDQHHQVATQHWQRVVAALPRLVTTSYVFDEVVMFFNSRGQHAKAIQVGNNLLQSPSVQFIHVDGVILRRMGVFPAPSGQRLLPHGLHLLLCHAEAGHPDGLCIRSALCPSGLHQRALAPDASSIAKHGAAADCIQRPLRSRFRQRLSASVGHTGLTVAISRGLY
jgi:hypothetical protein